MPQLFIQVQDMVLLHQTAPPTAEELRQTLSRLQALENGRPQGLVLWLAPMNGLPDDAARSQLNQVLGPMARGYRWLGMVIEGTGLGVSLRRTFAKAMFSLAGARSLQQFASLEEVAAQAPAELIGDRATFAARARQALAAG
jgi:hypothetical protein